MTQLRKAIINQYRLIPDRSDQLLTKQNQSHQSFMQATTNVCSFEGPPSQKPHSCAELACFPPLLNPCHTVPILRGRKKLRHKSPQRSEDFELCRQIFQRTRPQCILQVSTATVTWAQRSPQLRDISSTIIRLGHIYDPLQPVELEHP